MEQRQRECVRKNRRARRPLAEADRRRAMLAALLSSGWLAVTSGAPASATPAALSRHEPRAAPAVRAVGPQPVRLGQAPESLPTLRVGVAPEELRLDGLLTETAWSEADAIGSLTMVEPREGVPASMRTHVRVLANRSEIVIGVLCEDPDPTGIVAYSKARDAEMRREDHVRVVIDPFLDGRSGMVFAVNAAGARYDALVANRGESDNSDWDTAWEAATARTAEGWSLEIRLPIRSLKFKQELREWGFNLERRIERLQETDRWSGARRDWRVTHTAHAGRLAGLPEFDLGWGIDLRPSLTGGVGRTRLDGPVDTEGSASFDATKLLGPNLAASLTLNTDFAETEVDARQVNLTRFPLLFPEKRTFFLEGTDIFDFGLGLGRDLIPFFSRRIGLLAGQEVPVDAGLKLTGRAGDTNLGALIVRTGATDGVQPATMGVVRLQQNVLRESSVGLLAAFGDPRNRQGSWMAGVDFTYQNSRFRGDKNFLVGVWGLALDRRDLVSGDRTAYGLRLDYPNDLWDVALTYKRVGDAFDPSLGFVRRPGTHSLSLGISYQPRPAWSWVRQMFYEFRFSLVTNLQGQWESYRLFTAPVNWRLESGDRFEFNVVPQGERLFAPFEIVAGVVIPAGTYEFRRFRLEAGLAAKRRFSAEATWWFGGFFDGTLHQIELEAAWRPNPLLTFELSGEHAIGHLPAGDFTTDLLGARVRVNFSPDLVLSSFLQYDSESDSFGTNTRLRWTYDPLGDVFVIYNANVRDLGDRFATDVNQLLVKIAYTLRR